jgi:hypothetical protein
MATTVAQPTYFQLISQDDKTVQKESLKLKAQEAGLELNRQIFNLTVKVSQKEAEITKLQRQIPYSVATEYVATAELTNYKEQLEFAKTVKEERFADASI